jgi:hypothetical protein
MDLTKEVLARHIEAYFASSESERAVVCRLIDEAWRAGRDVVSDILPGREWRHDWPEAARAAVLALWATPR